MIARFPLLIDNAQMLVFPAGHPTPGLIWSDEHVAQGFAWNDNVVSFGIPDHDGECLVELYAGPHQGPAPDALWAIQVPFTVAEPVLVGSVFETHPVDVPEGVYNLVFEALPGGGGYTFTLRLTFEPTREGTFRILRRGGDITTDQVLRATAEPAL